jgi:hypothetical protein
MMLVPMALMGRSNNRNRPNEPSSTADEIAVLRDEVARLRQLAAPGATAGDPAL